MRASTAVLVGTLVVVLAASAVAMTSTGGADGASPDVVIQVIRLPEASQPTEPATADPGTRTLGARVGIPEGFGAGTTGGAGGRTVWVTSLDDDGPGTLREALAGDAGPVWVRFAVSGRIVLHTTIQIPSNVTVDGRGQRVEIAVDRDVTGFEIGEVENVIIHNLVFVGGAVTRNTVGEPRSDAITVLGGRRIWIDHNTMTGWGDKLIGIPAARDVTVSYNHLHDQGECVLIGVRSLPAGAAATRVTMHHNFFDRCASRTPRTGDGAWVHLYNNHVAAWEFSGVAAVRGAEVNSEHNIFAPTVSDRAVLADNGPGGPGFVSSSCDLALDDARINVNEPETVFDPRAYYEVGLHSATTALADWLEGWAGWQPDLGEDAAPEAPFDHGQCLAPVGPGGPDEG